MLWVTQLPAELQTMALRSPCYLNRYNVFSWQALGTATPTPTATSTRTMTPTSTPTVTRVRPGRMWIDPATGTYWVGNHFTVDIMADS